MPLGMHEGAAAPSFEIRTAGFAGGRRSQNDSFLYHFPAVSEANRKMMLPMQKRENVSAS